MSDLIREVRTLVSDPSKIPDTVGDKAVTSVRIGGTLLRDGYSVKNYKGKHPDGVSFGTIVLYAGDQSLAVDVGPSIYHGPAIGDILGEMGMGPDAVELVKRQHYANDFSTSGSGFGLYKWDGEKFYPISPLKARNVNYEDVVALIYPANNNKPSNTIIFSPNQELVDAFGHAGVGKSSKSTLLTLDEYGVVTPHDYTIASLSKLWYVLKVGGGAFLAAGIAILVGFLTALTFNLLALVISLIAIGIGIALSWGYETATNKPL
ncbi:MAG: hypothetical protein LBB14_03570 [Puniceicoccales bacterium]|jgi:hypothetical protein|nr:hypothetical protein [Puniceicoccales bacterium]